MVGQDWAKMRIREFFTKTEKILQVQKNYSDLLISYSDHIGERKCDGIVHFSFKETTFSENLENNRF